MEKLRVYKFKKPNTDEVCFKQNCMYFERTYSDSSDTLIYKPETCAIYKDIICNDLTCSIYELTNSSQIDYHNDDDVRDFYNTTEGYPSSLDEVLELPSCSNFKISSDVTSKLHLTEISGMTSQFLSFIKEHEQQFDGFEMEIILLLFKRIVNLENIIDSSKAGQVLRTLDVTSLEYQEQLRKNEQLRLEMKELRSGCEKLLNENLQLKEWIEKYKQFINTSTTEGGKSKLKRELNDHYETTFNNISTYIKSVFDRIKDNPGEYISEQDLLQILVYLEN